MILRLTFFILLFLSWQSNANAQQQKVLESLSQYTILKSSPAKNLKSNNMTLDLNQYGTWDVNLYENKIVADDIKILGASTGKALKVDVSAVQTYHGYVKNYPGDRVSMSIGEDFIQGQIITSHEIVYIESAKNYLKNADKEDVIVYSSKDVNPGATDHMCGNEEHQNLEFPKVGTQSKSFAGNCLEVEIGLAADYSMVEKYGSNQDVYEQMISVLNDTELLYDNEFEDGFNFTLGQIAISECSTCDPWTEDHDAQKLLQAFTIWASSNFDDLDQSSLWTNRDLNDNSNVGLAWIGSICQRFSCAVLEDSPNGAIKRVLMAHEMGHNFGANHDVSGSSSIMAPTLTDTDFWSEQSINDIQTTYKRASCFSSCEESLVAKIDFEVENNCGTFDVKFKDVSLGSTHSVRWFFEGANTTSSALSEPEITYTADGEYNVTLVVSTSSGLADTTRITLDVEIFGAPDVDFDYKTDEGFVDFNNLTQGASDYYWDFGDGSNSTVQHPEHTYNVEGDYQVTLYAQSDCGTANQSKIIRVIFEEDEEDEGETSDTLDYAVRELNLSVSSMCVGGRIDLNGNANGLTVEKWVIDGPIFYESALTQFNYSFETPGTYKISLYVIEDATNKRIVYTNTIDVIGEAEAIFEVVVNDYEIKLSNQSRYAQSYLWDFGDGNQSRETHPTHIYTQAGVYEVKLTTIGDCGFEVQTRRVVIQEQVVEDDVVVHFTASAYDSACAGDQILFQSSNVIENYTAQWRINEALVENYSEDTLVVALNEVGELAVALCYTNGTKTYCSDDTYKLNVQAETKAQMSVDYFGSYIRLNNLSTNETSVSWNIGNQINSSIENPIFLVSPGSYPSMLTAVNGCSEDALDFIVFADYNKPNFVATIQEHCEYTDILLYPNTTMESIRWTFIGQNHRINTSRNDVRLRPNESYQILADYYVSGIRYRYTIPYSIVTPGLPSSVIRVSDARTDTLLLESIGDATSFEWYVNDALVGTHQSLLYGLQEDVSTYRIKSIYRNECGLDSMETVYIKPSTVTLRDNQLSEDKLGHLQVKSYPNPFTNSFELDIVSPSRGTAILEIHDLSGREVEKRSLKLKKNHNIYSIDAQNWNTGTFILRVKSEGFVEMKRLIKIK